jgi:uncharacterized protein (DUF2235 family)
MKRIVVCMDGTWQRLSQERLTNIGIIARSIAHTNTTASGEKISQIVFYSQGVGANTDALGQASFMSNAQASFNKLAGGVFGEGLEDGIVDTYLRLAFNYEAGDELYIFGFSRGAFAARSLVGLINCSGIVSRKHAEQAWEAFRLYREPLPANATEEQKKEYVEARQKFRLLYGKGRRNADGTRVQTDDVPPINYLGIFDTVGQRGLPDAFGGLKKVFNKRYGFHNLRICPNVVQARHAVALDEQRLGFPPTLWEGLAEDNARVGRTAYEQRWFIGTHGDVGGGEGSALSAAPLKWIAEGAAAAGLRFYGTYGDDESPLNQMMRESGLGFDSKITRPKFWKSLSPMNYPVAPRKVWAKREPPTLADAERDLDISVALRAEAARVTPIYAPSPLRPFKGVLRQIAARQLKADEMRAERKRMLGLF